MHIMCYICKTNETENYGTKNDNFQILGAARRHQYQATNCGNEQKCSANKISGEYNGRKAKT